MLQFLNFLICADAGGDTTSNEGANSNQDDNNKPDDIETLKLEKEKLSKSYERVISESSTYKTRAQAAESKLAEFEKLQAEKSGDLQKQLELERNEHNETKNKYKSVAMKTIDSNLRIEALKLAKDAHDIDVVLGVEQHSSLLKIDHEALKVNGVDEYLKAVRKTHPYLFTKSKLPDQENKKPDGEHNSYKELSDRERYSKDIQACKTHAELEAVKEKWAGKKSWLVK